MKNTHAKEVISPDIHKHSAFHLTYFCSIFRYFIQIWKNQPLHLLKRGKKEKMLCCFTTIFTA